MITFWAVIVMVLLLMKSRTMTRKLKVKQLSKALKTLAARHELEMDTMLIRNNWGLGIDKEKLRLVYVQLKTRELKTDIFDIDQIDHCDILKTYSTPRIYFARGKKRKKYIDRILLHIRHNGQHDCHIPFYSHADDKVTEMKMLLEKARHWRRMILR